MRITKLFFVLLIGVSCSRSHSDVSRKTYDYVHDLPAGHLVVEQDLSMTTYEITSFDILPAQARKDFSRDFITDTQLRDVLGRPLTHDVRYGTKLRMNDFNAASSATTSN